MFSSKRRTMRSLSRRITMLYASEAFMEDLENFDDVGIIMPDDHKSAVDSAARKLKAATSAIAAKLGSGSDIIMIDSKSDIGKDDNARSSLFMIAEELGIGSPEEAKKVMSDAERMLYDRKAMLRIYSYWSVCILDDLLESVKAYSMLDRSDAIKNSVNDMQKIKTFMSDARRIMRR